MTDLVRRALLGDRQAQKECTRRGTVLPCPFCGGVAMIEYDTVSPFEYNVFCGDCGVMLGISEDKQVAISEWNTRPAPPIGRCGECKHSTNPAALTMIYGEPGTLTCHHGPCNRRNVNENDFCSYFEPKEEK